jgi:Protein of unknown function (DUF3634)
LVSELIVLINLGLVALIAWVLWRTLGPRTAFVVRVEEGAARVESGTVTPAFVQEISETCQRNRVTDGRVRGVIRDGRIVLKFSAGIPLPCQQQLRNLWSISGWSVKSRMRRRP